MADILENPVDLIDDAYEQEIQVEQEMIEVVAYRSYNRLDDKPQINGVELVGNKTSSDLGITAQIESAVNSEAQARAQADNTLQGKIDTEKLARQQADSTLQGNIDAEETARKAADKDIQDVLDGETLARQNADTALGGRIDTEIHDRQVADIGLQGQIDAITSKSDVVDVVATYADLQAYDTQHLGDNDVIKVLDDETHGDALTYYRWSKTNQTWTFIGQEAPYYSKSQTDTLLLGKQNTIDSSHKLSADLVDDTSTTNKFVTASDITNWNAKQDALTAGTGIDITGGVISTQAIVPEVVAELPTTGAEGKLYLVPKDSAKVTAIGDSLSITTASGKDVLVTPVAILGEVEQDTTVSPTPDNPQAINYVTGDQTVTIQGKNLICPESRYDSDSHITVEYNSDSGEVHLSGTPALGWSYLTAQNKSCSIPAGTYRLTTDSASVRYVKTVRFFHNGGGYTAASISVGFTAATVTLTKPAIAYYIAVVYQGDYQTYDIDDTFKLQLAAGSESTEIEPYHNESITLPLGNTRLRRVGDYADRIAKVNNAWVVERNTATGTLTGIEGWYSVGQDYFTRTILGARPTSELQIISSKLLGLPRDDLSGNNYITMSHDGNIRVNIAGITSSEALTSLLESNNIGYCYGLLAPEYEAIEDATLLERLELLEALHIDKGGTTTISVSATGVIGELQITYYEVEPDDKYDAWFYIDGGYERIDADNGLVPTDGGYIVEGETNSSNAIWSQWSNRLAFGMDTATAPVPAQFNGQIFVDGTIIAHNTGNNSHNRWGFHVYEAYASDNYSRMTMLLNKHDNEFDGKKSFEAYYYTGDSHKNSAYGFFKVGSDVKYHSFLFDRDKMIASGEIDCRFPVTLARINPSTDLDDTYSTVEAADTAYEAESQAEANLKCIKYLALKNAQDGAMWYDTDRNKIVVKINGEWHDMNTTAVPEGTYDF